MLTAVNLFEHLKTTLRARAGFLNAARSSCPQSANLKPIKGGLAGRWAIDEQGIAARLVFICRGARFKLPVFSLHGGRLFGFI